MSLITEFETHLPAALRKDFRCLVAPIDIQRYLDSIPYIGEERNRSPMAVMLDRQCHCLDGALFAALAIRRMGERGLIIDLVPGKDKQSRKLDDDHVLALFRRHGLWGAVAKSNFPWLRYREPVYRTVRELVMSYFEVYYSLEGTKALRGYTRPFDIANFDDLEYAWDERGANALYAKFYARKPTWLLPPETEALLEPVDKLAYDSGILGVNWDWVYRPPR